MNPVSTFAPQDQARPFLELAEGLLGVYERLQPTAPGATSRSAGDRLEDLAPDRGPLADTVRKGLAQFEDILRWLDKALLEMDPWLLQADVVLAFGALMSGAVDGAAEAGKGLAAAGAALVKPNQTPAQIYAQLDGDVGLREAYLKLQSKLSIIPPPEDLAAVQAALLPLLAPTPAPGARSIPSLRARLGPAGGP